MARSSSLCSLFALDSNLNDIDLMRFPINLYAAYSFTNTARAGKHDLGYYGYASQTVKLALGHCPARERLRPFCPGLRGFYSSWLPSGEGVILLGSAVRAASDVADAVGPDPPPLPLLPLSLFLPRCPLSLSSGR